MQLLTEQIPQSLLDQALSLQGSSVQNPKLPQFNQHHRKIFPKFDILCSRSRYQGERKRFARLEQFVCN